MTLAVGRTLNTNDETNSMYGGKINSFHDHNVDFLSSADNIANSLDPDQDRQNLGSDLVSKWLPPW